MFHKKLYIVILLFLISKNSLAEEDMVIDFESQFRLSAARIELCYIERILNKDNYCEYYWSDVLFLSKHAGKPSVVYSFGGLKPFPTLDDLYKDKKKWLDWIDKNRHSLPPNDWKYEVNPNENLNYKI